MKQLEYPRSKVNVIVITGISKIKIGTKFYPNFQILDQMYILNYIIQNQISTILNNSGVIYIIILTFFRYNHPLSGKIKRETDFGFMGFCSFSKGINRSPTKDTSYIRYWILESFTFTPTLFLVVVSSKPSEGMSQFLIMDLFITFINPFIKLDF